MSKKGEFPGVDFLGTTLKFTKRKGAFDWELKSGFRIERKIRNRFQRWDMCSWIRFLSVLFFGNQKKDLKNSSKLEQWSSDFSIER